MQAISIIYTGKALSLHLFSPSPAHPELQPLRIYFRIESQCSRRSLRSEKLWQLFRLQNTAGITGFVGHCTALNKPGYL